MNVEDSPVATFEEVNCYAMESLWRGPYGKELWVSFQDLRTSTYSCKIFCQQPYEVF